MRGYLFVSRLVGGWVCTSRGGFAGAAGAFVGCLFHSCCLLLLSLPWFLLVCFGLCLLVAEKQSPVPCRVGRTETEWRASTASVACSEVTIAKPLLCCAPPASPMMSCLQIASVSYDVLVLSDLFLLYCIKLLLCVTSRVHSHVFYTP